MKKAFSLLELIFAIIVISIVASFAIPKYMDIKNSATVSTVKRDIQTIITSVQAYYLSQGNITNISDAVNINKSNWIIESKKVSDKNSCLYIELKLDENPKIELVVDENKDGICKKYREENIVSTSYDL